MWQLSLFAGFILLLARREGCLASWFIKVSWFNHQPDICGPQQKDVIGQKYSWRNTRSSCLTFTSLQLQFIHFQHLKRDIHRIASNRIESRKFEQWIHYEFMINLICISILKRLNSRTLGSDYERIECGGIICDIGIDPVEQGRWTIMLSQPATYWIQFLNRKSHFRSDAFEFRPKSVEPEFIFYIIRRVGRLCADRKKEYVVKRARLKQPFRRPSNFTSTQHVADENAACQAWMSPYLDVMFA